MKNYFYFLVKSLLIVSLIFAVGCDKDDDDDGSGNNTTIKDPEGAITGNISSNPNVSITIVPEGAGGFYIGWTGPSNFSLGCYNLYDSGEIFIYDAGKVRGLGDITKIPTSGFSTRPGNSIACEVGHGYIIKYTSGRMTAPVYYVRLYVVEDIVNTSGGIFGTKVKYQHPFEP